MAFLQHSTVKYLPIFFNVHQNVGRNCPNQPEDVALVSFLLVKWAEASGGARSRELSPKVTIGTYDANLQAMIDLALESAKAGNPYQIADGHVSRAPPGAYYAGGQAAYLICGANYKVAKSYARQWPRLDLIEKCPPAVTTMIQREVMAD